MAESDAESTDVGGLRYVIQKHWASHLHYDLRLQLGGTMHSWAVPKGPSLDPADKRLAVQVEDHPIAYNDFEGQIPAGQYGAGRVIVWDRGTWAPVGDAARGLAKGHLKFDLHGIKLRGRWALVRLKDANATQPPWLLIKDRDAEARPARDYRVTEALPDSVGPGHDAGARGGKQVAPLAPQQVAKEATKSSPKPRATSRAIEAADAPVKTSRRAEKKAQLPQQQAPQLARLLDAPPPDVDAWQWEMKFDGYRLLARIDAAGAVRLVTRNGLDWTARMPELARAVAALRLPGSWLDGEIVMPDAHALPDFAALQRAFDERRTAHLIYYLFDAPWLQGADLQAQPLTERRAQLQAALKPMAANGSVRLSPILPPQPHSLLASACRMGLEGVIGKRRDAPYRSGRSHAWVKLKCVQQDEFVVAGFTAGQGARGALGALVLAAHDADGALRWAGNVGSGLSGATLAALLRRLAPLAQTTSPLATGDKVPGKVRWVQPSLVAQVRHAGLTPQGHVRQAVFLAMREDKAAQDVERPKVSASKVTPAPARWAQAAIKTGSTMEPTPSLQGQKLTHPERVIDPTSGTTKLALARYYATVAPLIQPHLTGRPVALLRAPDGLDGELFFQKHLQGRPMQAVTQLPPTLDPGHAPLMAINSPAALLAVVQMNAVELHTWNATADKIERPDRFVLDLDPGEGVPWAKVQQAAQLAHTLLTELALVPFLKTSGGKGLHVVVPIKRLYGWDAVKDFSRALTEHLARLMPDRFSAISGPKNRVGRIYPDYLRNGRGATTVAAWSARARPGMGVSVPLRWDELGQVGSGAHWTLANIEQRLRVGNAPWQGWDASARPIGAAARQLAQSAGG